jgi:hypothetical protein
VSEMEEEWLIGLFDPDGNELDAFGISKELFSTISEGLKDDNLVLVAVPKDMAYGIQRMWRSEDEMDTTHE